MDIKVTDMDTDEVIFIGDADDFLFTNDNDEELAEFLYELETTKIGESKIYCGNFTDRFLFEKEDIIV